MSYNVQRKAKDKYPQALHQPRHTRHSPAIIHLAGVALVQVSIRLIGGDGGGGGGGAAAAADDGGGGDGGGGGVVMMAVTMTASTGRC